MTQLQLLAEGHEPFDEAESRHRRAILDWLAAAERPLDRDSYEPGHATGSGFIVSDSGEIALIFHRKLRFWAQPGGHAEPHETDIAVVAARESAEELGIAVDPAAMTLFDLDVHEIPPRAPAPAHLHFDFRFLAVVAHAALDHGTDAEDAGWFPAGDAVRLDTDPSMLRMIEKARRLGIVGRR